MEAECLRNRRASGPAGEEAALVALGPEVPMAEEHPDLGVASLELLTYRGTSCSVTECLVW